MKKLKKTLLLIFVGSYVGTFGAFADQEVIESLARDLKLEGGDFQPYSSESVDDCLYSDEDKVDDYDEEDLQRKRDRMSSIKSTSNNNMGLDCECVDRYFNEVANMKQLLDDFAEFEATGEYPEGCGPHEDGKSMKGKDGGRIGRDDNGNHEGETSGGLKGGDDVADDDSKIGGYDMPIQHPTSFCE
jgi:hypothetical protein